MNRQKLIQWLQTHGCEFLRHGGRHAVWINPANGKMASVPRHRQVKKYTARTVCRDLEIPSPFKN